MARKPFPIRLDTNVIDKIEALSKSLGIPKSQIVDVALERYLATLNTYAEMDKAPPKTVPLALARKVKGGTLKPGGVTHVDGFSDAAVVLGRAKAKAQTKAQPTRSVRGYAIDGSPIYR